MNRDKIILSQQADLAVANNALADDPTYSDNECVDFYRGYWVGKRIALRESLTLLSGKELEAETTETTPSGPSPWTLSR